MKNEVSINNKIYTLRNQQVMLDRDLAELYNIKTRRLREQVRRNKERFPSDFMFQLTETEVKSIASKHTMPSFAVVGLDMNQHVIKMTEPLCTDDLAQKQVRV